MSYYFAAVVELEFDIKVTDASAPKETHNLESPCSVDPFLFVINATQLNIYLHTWKSGGI